MIFIRCVAKGVWLVRVRNDEDAIALHYGTTLWHWHGGVYLIMNAAETTFNSKRESKNRYGHGRSGRTYGYGPALRPFSLAELGVGSGDETIVQQGYYYSLIKGFIIALGVKSSPSCYQRVYAHKAVMPYI